MLELNIYYNTSINNLKNFIIVTFVIIEDIYHKATLAYIKNGKSIDSAILSNSEIITISLVGKLLTIDFEIAWFGFCTKNLNDLFPNFCSRTRFQRTKKSLFKVFEQIRFELINTLGYQYEN